MWTTFCRRTREQVASLQQKIKMGHYLKAHELRLDTRDWMFQDAVWQGGDEWGGGSVLDSGPDIQPPHMQRISFPTFPVATPNSLVAVEMLTFVWSSNSEGHDTHTQAIVQREYIK